MTAESSGQDILKIEGVKKLFPVGGGLIKKPDAWVHAVDGVSLSVRKGETLGLVGESGSGKSTLARLVLRLLEPTEGRIIFKGCEITDLSGRKLRAMRRHMQLVLQDPYASLDPRMTAAQLIAEPLIVHGEWDRSSGRAQVQEIMEQVGLDPDHANRHPHAFSGGQRQRIGVARAIALKPDLIVLDEPVSALDVSIQAQIINLLQDLQEELNLTYIFIAHDLSVVRHICDRVAVMYLGKIVEMASRNQLYGRPAHPYTISLMSAVPVVDFDGERTVERVVLHGEMPSPTDPPSGCRFHTRCYRARIEADEGAESDGDVPVICAQVEPDLTRQDTEHWAACHFPERQMAGTGDVHPSADER